MYTLNWSCRGKKSSTNMLPIMFDCPFVSTPTCKTLKRRKRETKYLPFEIGTLCGRSRGRAGRSLSTSIASSASRLISSNHFITTNTYIHIYIFWLAHIHWLCLEGIRLDMNGSMILHQRGSQCDVTILWNMFLWGRESMVFRLVT